VLRVLRIDRQHPLYPQEIDLRERVLLRPIGYTIQRFQKDWAGVEERFEHFIAIAPNPKGERVVGTVCLLPPDPTTGPTASAGSPAGGRNTSTCGKLMQMAVDPQRQREGIGRLLMAALERRAFGELGLTELYCHARDDAMPFYLAMGWQADGEGFEEAGIPHHRMVFRPDWG